MARRFAFARRRASRRPSMRQRIVTRYRSYRASRRGGRKATKSISLTALLPVLKLGLDLVVDRPGVQTSALTLYKQGKHQGALKRAVNTVSLNILGLPVVNDEGHKAGKFNSTYVTEFYGLAAAGWLARKVGSKLGANRAVKSGTFGMVKL